jgi:hypothetical protein
VALENGVAEANGETRSLEHLDTAVEGRLVDGPRGGEHADGRAGPQSRGSENRRGVQLFSSVLMAMQL